MGMHFDKKNPKGLETIHKVSNIHSIDLTHHLILHLVPSCLNRIIGAMQISTSLAFASRNLEGTPWSATNARGLPNNPMSNVGTSVSMDHDLPPCPRNGGEPLSILSVFKAPFLDFDQRVLLNVVHKTYQRCGGKNMEKEWVASYCLWCTVHNGSYMESRAPEVVQCILHLATIIYNLQQIADYDQT